MNVMTNFNYIVFCVQYYIIKKYMTPVLQRNYRSGYLCIIV